MSTIIESKGDLFTSSPPSSALAHCVSADFHMGKGIALTFRKRFGNTDELLRQKKDVGQTAILTKCHTHSVIFYLITKKKYYHKPTLMSLRSSLEDMKRLCIKMEINEISIPKIGCGLDRLRWTDVSSILHDVFSDTNIKIYVFYL